MPDSKIYITREEEEQFARVQRQFIWSGIILLPLTVLIMIFGPTPTIRLAGTLLCVAALCWSFVRLAKATKLLSELARSRHEETELESASEPDELHQAPISRNE